MDQDMPPDPPRGDATFEDLPLGERLRRRTGLSEAQWFVATTVVVTIPYPVFAYVLVFRPFQPTTSFLIFTLVYSVFAIVAYQVL